LGRGFSDTLEHLLPFTTATLAWWLGVLLIVPAPGATVALFRITDPRITSDLDRPGVRASISVAGASLGRGWAIALPVGIPLAVLIVNLIVFADSASRLAVLVPLWTVLVVLGLICGLAAFSLAAILDLPARAALKQGLLLTGARLPVALPLAVMIWLVIAGGLLLVVPIVMFLPATITAIVNRFVLHGFGIPITDPLEPTDERVHEQQTGSGSSWFRPWS
jgi:uncharacterized membrane protein YesL